MTGHQSWRPTELNAALLSSFIPNLPQPVFLPFEKKQRSGSREEFLVICSGAVVQSGALLLVKIHSLVNLDAESPSAPADLLARGLLDYQHLLAGVKCGAHVSAVISAFKNTFT